MSSAPTSGPVHQQMMLAEVARRMFGGQAASAVRVGRYILIDEIGSGGMGSVYRAYDAKLDRRVALKVLRADVVNGPRAKARLRREAVALASLSDPNVVAIHEVGECEDEVFLAMEFVEGSNLAQWAERSGKTERETALRLIVEAARGLAAAHRSGLVHRDVKPANVLVGDDGRARIADFGLVRQGQPSSSESDRSVEYLTSPGATSSRSAGGGTRRYASPEALRGGRVDARSDQFSLCVTAWEVLFGRLPWPVEPVPDRPPRSPAGEPAWLVDVLRVGLRPDPAQRYDSVEDLISALSRAPARRRRRRVATLVGALAAVASVGGYAYHRSARCEQGDAPLAETNAALEELDTSSRESIVRYGEQWREASRTVCLSDEPGRAAKDCLATAKAGLLGVVQAGATGAADTSALPPPTACLAASDAWVLPGDRTDGALSTYRSTAHARTVQARGEDERARQILAATEGQVFEASAAIQIRTLDVQAEAARREGDLARATLLATRAYETAMVAGEATTAAALAATLRALATAQGSDAVASLWKRHAALLSE